MEGFSPQVSPSNDNKKEAKKDKGGGIDDMEFIDEILRLKEKYGKDKLLQMLDKVKKLIE